MYTYEESIKHYLKQGRGKGEWECNREGELVPGTVHMYGIITMKSPCIMGD
jgi:hypothetical protein